MFIIQSHDNCWVDFGNTCNSNRLCPESMYEIFQFCYLDNILVLNILAMHDVVQEIRKKEAENEIYLLLISKLYYILT